MRSVTTLKTSYNSSGSRIFLETFFSPIFLTQGVVPPATLHYGRILWPSSGTEGNAIASIGPAGPSVTIQVTRPHKFDLLSSASPRPSPVDGSEEEDVRPHLPQQGLAAFTRGSGFSQYGLTLAGLDSQLNAEWGVNFEELSLELRTGAHLRTTGHIEWEATGIWKWPAELDDSMHGVMIPGRHDTSISAGVVLEFGGVHLVFEYVTCSTKLSLYIDRNSLEHITWVKSSSCLSKSWATQTTELPSALLSFLLLLQLSIILSWQGQDNEPGASGELAS
jgi:hypothetical protein